MKPDTCPRDAFGFCLLALAANRACLRGEHCVQAGSREEKLDRLERVRQMRLKNIGERRHAETR